jgi:hypothetical protein
LSQFVLKQKKHGFHVDIEDEIVLSLRLFDYRPFCTRNPGVVKSKVESPERIQNRWHDGLHFSGIAEIRSEEHHFARIPIHLSNEPLAFHAAASGQQNVPTQFANPFRGCSAYS